MGFQGVLLGFSTQVTEILCGHFEAGVDHLVCNVRCPFQVHAGGNPVVLDQDFVFGCIDCFLEHIHGYSLAPAAHGAFEKHPGAEPGVCEIGDLEQTPGL